MKNPRFSIGYNFDYEGFRYLTEKYGKNLDSVYFPIPKKHLGSGRILDEPPAYKKEIIGLIKLCQDRGITSIMLLNSTVVSAAQIKKSVSYLKKLVSRTGLFNVVVTDPYLIKIIKKTIPNINIEASTLTRIRTVQEAKYFKELGVSKITPDREIMRNLKTLIKIKEILPMKILANEGCIKNCIHRYSHYNMLSSQIIEKSIMTGWTRCAYQWYQNSPTKFSQRRLYVQKTCIDTRKLRMCLSFLPETLTQKE